MTCTGGGTPTITNSTIDANSVVMFGLKTAGGTPAVPIMTAVTAGTSFQITCGGSDTSAVAVAAAVACGLAALCYAEFASTVPVAGSAYTFSYATFGELIAWIVGWDLILEFTVGSAALASAAA